MPLVTLFKEFVEITPGCVINIPFTVDTIEDVLIQVGGGLSLEVQSRIETQSGELILANTAIDSELLFPGSKLKANNYRLVITVGNINMPFYAKVIIEGYGYLQMETIVIPSTLNSPKTGLIQTHLFYKEPDTPIEDATVSIDTHILENRGNGIYATTFPPNFTTETGLIDVYARGYYQGIAFQRHYGQVVKAFGGELIFTGPYSWQVIRDSADLSIVTSIILHFGVEVRKSGSYGVGAWITDVSDQKIAGQDQEWLAEKPANIPNRAESGDHWVLEPGIHNLQISFDGAEVLKCGEGPYRLYQLLAYFEYDDDGCDAVIDPDGFPLLLLNR